jgi:hypothetical protein
MKKIAVLATLALLTAVVSARAAPTYTPAPPPPPRKPHPAKPKPHPARPHRCVPRQVGYYASGTLVNASLSEEGHRRYGGTLEVDLHRANHGAPIGDQTFTLAGGRVKFHHGVDPGSPAPGSRVKLHGKITKLAKRCPSEGFTPTIAVKKVDIRQAK